MKKHILVVEDEASSQLILKNLLYKDYELTIKENGAKALDWLAKGNITDLIITDLEMPVMNGFEMIGALDENEKYNALPVIIISSMDRTEVFESDKISQDKTFLQKPILRIDLKKALNSVLKPS